ncbi:hypothetical protein ALC53_06050 [Atta colombica]|uniref:Uncharacterized protein n=1 Tax=Atta colombica TaxID=520822 RepID=A0A151I3J1_9HYME|nr:hypothetical protein ALC53_06050 [Atta colombica]
MVRDDHEIVTRVDERLSLAGINIGIRFFSEIRNEFCLVTGELSLSGSTWVRIRTYPKKEHLYSPSRRASLHFSSFPFPLLTGLIDAGCAEHEEAQKQRRQRRNIAAPE